ncbi:hypothetical protein ERJ75_000122600 [Trypanosoma vivax]|nr:hypothetical protein ERJ75_000122600 [Trypanosoma vivax]
MRTCGATGLTCRKTLGLCTFCFAAAVGDNLCVSLLRSEDRRCAVGDAAEGLADEKRWLASTLKRADAFFSSKRWDERAVLNSGQQHCAGTLQANVAVHMNNGSALPPSGSNKFLSVILLNSERPFMPGSCALRRPSTTATP